MTEGIVYQLTDGAWVVETNNWPKGYSRARLQVDKDGTRNAPFTPSNNTLAHARELVATFIEQEQKKSHGYTRFAILPLAGDPMPDEVKEAFAARKKEKQGTVSESTQEEDEMARTDGRTKCTTRGCHNYVAPPVTTCKTCRNATDIVPGATGGSDPTPTPEPVPVAIPAPVPEPTPHIIDQVIALGDTETSAQPLKPRSATAEAKRTAEISKPEYVAAFEKALAERTKKTCKAGHDLTQIENAHVGDLKRTGKITCDLCNRAAQVKHGTSAE